MEDKLSQYGLLFYDGKGLLSYLYASGLRLAVGGWQKFLKGNLVFLVYRLPETGKGSQVSRTLPTSKL